MNIQQHGFTLIELLTTLAVTIILMSVGIPLYRSLVANNLAVAQVNAMVTALNLARSEAVKEATTVSVCPVSNANATSPQCTGNTTWTSGWMVFTDTGTRGTVDGSDQRLRLWKAFTPAPTIATSVAYVSYDSTGYATGYTASGTAKTGATEIQMSQANSTGSQTRCVNVALSGAIYTTQGACP